MRRWSIMFMVLSLSFALAAAAARADEYDGCAEQFYDSAEEPCGGGHQHMGGKRDEVMLERSRHRHRYLEDQIRQLSAKVDMLSGELEKLKKPAGN